MNILVVEDDNIQRENLVKIIEKNFIDIRVYKAESYDEAIYYINNKDNIRYGTIQYLGQRI